MRAWCSYRLSRSNLGPGKSFSNQAIPRDGSTAVFDSRPPQLFFLAPGMTRRIDIMVDGPYCTINHGPQYRRKAEE